jgi:hypothetical protein
MSEDARVSGLRGPRLFTQAEVIASLPERLCKFEGPEDGCWIWTGRRHPTNGYAGSTSYQGRKGTAYRLIWEIVNGELVGKGHERVLDHICNNGPGGCVNPNHLRATTHKDNLLRDGSKSPTKALAEATHCAKGHEFTPENTFYPNKTEKGKVKKHWRACRQCHRENLRRWQRENPERVRELRRKYDSTPQAKAKRAERQKRYRERKKAGLV